MNRIHMKKYLMATVVAGAVMVPTWGQAASLAAYANLGASAAGMVFSIIGTLTMPFMVAGVNIDPAQLAAEQKVLEAVKNVSYNWHPEPEKEYQAAAQHNGAGSGGNPGGVDFDMTPQTLAFQAASLKNVGIEAINVGTKLSELATSETREKILTGLEWLQSKTSTGAGEKDEAKGTPDAGSCAANYSVCSKYDQMTPAERNLVVTRQRQNEQYYGTAGIAHAELGLMAVQQAIKNDGSPVGEKGAAASINQTFVPGQTTPVQDLSAMIGTGANTVASMKIVALMNLELAQRLNQGNMLQGSILTIEAARVFPDTASLTD